MTYRVNGGDPDTSDQMMQPVPRGSVKLLRFD
jgi:hypothetical protein